MFVEFRFEFHVPNNQPHHKVEQNKGKGRTDMQSNIANKTICKYNAFDFFTRIYAKYKE